MMHCAVAFLWLLKSKRNRRKPSENVSLNRKIALLSRRIKAKRNKLDTRFQEIVCIWTNETAHRRRGLPSMYIRIDEACAPFNATNVIACCNKRVPSTYQNSFDFEIWNIRNAKTSSMNLFETHSTRQYVWESCAISMWLIISVFIIPGIVTLCIF